MDYKIQINDEQISVFFPENSHKTEYNYELEGFGKLNIIKHRGDKPEATDVIVYLAKSPNGIIVVFNKETGIAICKLSEVYEFETCTKLQKNPG